MKTLLCALLFNFYSTEGAARAKSHAPKQMFYPSTTNAPIADQPDEKVLEIANKKGEIRVLFVSF